MSKCANCETELPRNVVHFCRDCFFKLPAKERHQIVRMTYDRQDLTTKIAKCVRILKQPVASRATR